MAVWPKLGRRWAQLRGVARPTLPMVFHRGLFFFYHSPRALFPDQEVRNHEASTDLEFRMYTPSTYLCSIDQSKSEGLVRLRVMRSCQEVVARLNLPHVTHHSIIWEFGSPCSEVLLSYPNHPSFLHWYLSLQAFQSLTSPSSQPLLNYFFFSLSKYM